jgi:hypothetical protein
MEQFCIMVAVLFLGGLAGCFLCRDLDFPTNPVPRSRRRPINVDHEAEMLKKAAAGRTAPQKAIKSQLAIMPKMVVVRRTGKY